LQGGDRVLDVACGTGLGFQLLRELVGDDGHVTGVDLTPAMLDIARQRIARHGWGNVEVREADAADLPFPDATFDKVACMYGMSIIPDFAEAIAEVARVLVPGGRFVVLDVKLSDNALVRWLTPVFLRMGHICAVDLSHRTIDELRRMFAEVQVHEYRAGLVHVAVATKG
ncbi:MAG: methyltransferase domain-containing protein, partial [Chloroflexota bacterium]